MQSALLIQNWDFKHIHMHIILHCSEKIHGTFSLNNKLYNVSDEILNSAPGGNKVTVKKKKSPENGL